MTTKAAEYIYRAIVVLKLQISDRKVAVMNSNDKISFHDRFVRDQRRIRIPPEFRVEKKMLAGSSIKRHVAY